MKGIPALTIGFPHLTWSTQSPAQHPRHPALDPRLGSFLSDLYIQSLTPSGVTRAYFQLLETSLFTPASVSQGPIQPLETLPLPQSQLGTTPPGDTPRSPSFFPQDQPRSDPNSMSSSHPNQGEGTDRSSLSPWV